MGHAWTFLYFFRRLTTLSVSSTNVARVVEPFPAAFASGMLDEEGKTVGADVRRL